MKLRDIISQVSEMYVNANDEVNNLYKKINEIGKILNDDDKLDNLLYTEYCRLISKKI